MNQTQGGEPINPYKANQLYDKLLNLESSLDLIIAMVPCQDLEGWAQFETDNLGQRFEDVYGQRPQIGYLGFDDYLPAVALEEGFVVIDPITGVAQFDGVKPGYDKFDVKEASKKTNGIWFEFGKGKLSLYKNGHEFIAEKMDVDVFKNLLSQEKYAHRELGRESLNYDTIKGSSFIKRLRHFGKALASNPYIMDERE